MTRSIALTRLMLIGSLSALAACTGSQPGARSANTGGEEATRRVAEIVEVAPSEYAIRLESGKLLEAPCEERWAEAVPVDADGAPEIEYWAAPEYPNSLRRRGIEGDVYIDVLVDGLGQVVLAKVLESPHIEFTQQALISAFQCEFAPAFAGGVPTCVWVTIPFRFSLI